MHDSIARPDPHSLLSNPANATPRLGRVGVLLGGLSSEREVSLLSGGSVLAALLTPGPRPAPEHLEAIEWRPAGTPGGELVFGDRVLPFHEGLAHLVSFDVLFLALHGGAGEDGRLQGLLDLLGIAYTGSGHAASAIAMDKWRTREVARALGLALAPGFLAGRAELRAGLADAGARAALETGWVIKPRADGSSVGVELGQGLGALQQRLEQRLETERELVVEARIRGLELTCAVLEGGPEGPRALPPVEIVPRGSGWFDFQQKYQSDGAEEFCPPRQLPLEAQARVQQDALALHRALGCRGLTRTDFIWPLGAQGGLDPAARPVVLELNTLPGLTPRSLAPLAARAAGIDYRELCLTLLEAASRRFGA
jgi:D-alanine-D-alanine ligase